MDPAGHAGQSLPLAVSESPVELSRPAVAGRSYEILSADSLTNPIQVRASVVPTNDLGQWMETESNQVQSFDQAPTYHRRTR